MKYRTDEGADTVKQTRSVKQNKIKAAVNPIQTIQYKQPRRPVWCHRRTFDTKCVF
jgi:hypothetical protein